MSNKTALIFGHSSGLGHELTQVMINDGYSVVGISRRKSSIDSPKLKNLEYDLSQKEQIDEVIDMIKTNHHKFVALIFAAGTLTAHAIDNLDYVEIERLFKVNTFAPMVIESALLPEIKNNGADIINITTIALFNYYPAFAEYSATKAAIAKFTQDLQKELFDTPSRVIDFCPSGFTSDIYKVMTGDKVNRDESLQMKSADLAELILYTLKLPKRIEITKILINRKPV
jgi:3-oxoacyl-[acyl-carrier protein] reductase